MKKSLLLSLLFIFLITINSFAIPAFGRKYSMSCQTCHSPFPKLKPYGDEFAKNGFVLADKDAPRYFLATGDEELSLIRDVPIALRLEGYATFKHRSNMDNFEIGSPRLLKILSGGSIYKDVSYYFYFYLSEKGEIAGLEDAYIMFNNLFDTNIDLYLGQFQISDPLFKRELRLTLEDYQIYKKKIGLSNINLAYDRGLMLNYGLPTQTDLTFEILNGSGIGPVQNDDFNNDRFVNLVGRLSQEVNDNIRVGTFGFFGKESLPHNVNQVNMLGVDFTINFGTVMEINFQYLNRKDSEPDTNYSNIKTNGTFIELIYTPKGDESKWYVAVLGNYIDSDYSNADYKSLALHYGYLLRRNLRLVGEFSYDFINKSNNLSVGFVSAF